MKTKKITLLGRSNIVLPTKKMSSIQGGLIPDHQVADLGKPGGCACCICEPKTSASGAGSHTARISG